MRQIYTGNIWEKSAFRKKTKKGSAGLRLNHRLQADPKLRGLQEPQHEYTQHTHHTFIQHVPLLISFSLPVVFAFTDHFNQFI